MKDFNYYGIYLIFFILTLCKSNIFSQNISLTQVNSGLVEPNLKIMDLDINISGHIFACTWYGEGLFRSTNNGDVWSLLNTGLPTSNLPTSKELKICELGISPNGVLFFGGTIGDKGTVLNSYGIGLYRSTNNGASWSKTSLEEGNLNAIAFNSDGDIFTAMASDIEGYYGIHRSTDGGETWTNIADKSDIFYVEEIAINSNGDIYVGTYQDGLFRSTDNGDNWTLVNSSFMKINSILFSSSGDIFIGSGDDGIFRSSDSGNTWTQINNGLSDLDVYGLVINSIGHIFAGTYGGGVFKSTDNGNSWVQINDGLTNLNIFSIAINSNDVIFLGTYGGGIFRSSKTTTSVDRVTKNIPDSFRLFQNYPNPFNPRTVISYSIWKSDFVSLKIYDISGCEIQTLVNEFQDANTYKVDFVNSRLSSGIYFYRLKVGNDFTETKKMIYLH